MKNEKNRKMSRQSFAKAVFERKTNLVLNGLALGIAPNFRDSRGDTPLTLAVMNMDTDMVKVLVDGGADMNGTDSAGNTPLLLAIHEKFSGIAEFFVLHGADPNIENNLCFSPLVSAARNKDTRMVKLLLSHGAGKKNQLNMALLEACYRGDAGTIELLLAAGADVNTRNRVGTTAGMYAAWSGNPGAFDLMDSYGADWFDTENETMESAIGRVKNKYIAKKLLDLGLDVNSRDNDGNTVLMHAADLRDFEMAKMLLERGGNVNVQNRHGNTALMSSAANGDIDTMSLLLKNGADIGIENKFKDTAFSVALKCGKNGAAEVLAAAGADINKKNMDGMTPLMVVAESGNCEPVEFLLSRGADVFAKDRKGMTALEIGIFKSIGLNPFNVKKLAPLALLASSMSGRCSEKPFDPDIIARDIDNCFYAPQVNKSFFAMLCSIAIYPERCDALEVLFRKARLKSSRVLLGIKNCPLPAEPFLTVVATGNGPLPLEGAEAANLVSMMLDCVDENPRLVVEILKKGTGKYIEQWKQENIGGIETLVSRVAAHLAEIKEIISEDILFF